MDTIKQQILELIGKYKYVLVVIMVGLALMLMPGREEELPAADPPEAEIPTMQEALEQILSKIQGVGRVQVLLTEAQGERTVYVFDESSSGYDSVRSDAVILTDASRAQAGMVSQVLPPVYLGAIVVCQGGDSPSVRLAIVEAISDATGLSADKVTVLKMK